MVIAAQVARCTRRRFEDIARIGEAVATSTSSNDLRAVLTITWTRSLAERGPNRWVRTSALGSASARPELETAIAEVHDETVARLCRILAPCRDQGWLRLGIDLASAVELMDSLRFGRIHIERGQMNVILRNGINSQSKLLRTRLSAADAN